MPFWNRLAVCLLVLTAAQTSTVAQNTAVTVSIDAAANRHPINPQIYGIAAGTTAVLSDLNCPLNRYGGNNATRYNWQINADNRGSDWYFQSIPDASAVAGERGDTFITNSRAANAQPMLTIPTIGWVGKLGASRNKLSSFSIAKYGAQTGSDSQFFPDAGNGILSATGQYVTGNDPNDANVPADSAFQIGWVNHLLATWNLAGAGGLKYYILDNEPSIWHGSHRDVHPVGATMGEVRDKMADYATRIKAADPGALVVGPEEWGWSGYFYSGYDQQYGSIHGWSSLPDRNANAGADYLPWLLDQMRQKSATAGKRLLDVFSVHYYPQGGEYGSDTSTTMQLLRNRSTRSLWDPGYIDQSWIGAPVQLIPRLKSWVSSYYPGTQVGLTEYNWGADAHINGATTQADIFGIFGREGLDMAARWAYPDPSTPTYLAMKLYRNYDGQKSTFGDTSVSASAPNPDNLASFAAVRSSDGALTVVVISKVLSGSTPVTLSLANFQPGASAQVWQLTSANAITRLADAPVSAGSLALSVPAQSISLLVIPNGTASKPAAPTGLTAKAGNAQVALAWTAVTGAISYNVKRAGVSGGPYTTVGTGVTSSAYTDTGLTNRTAYYYVVSAVNGVGESANSSEAFATPQVATAVFIKTDAGTQGSWKGVYGADGYSVLGDTTSLPTYASVGVSGQTAYTWSASTSDVRALQKAASTTDRIASCYYSFSSLTYDVNLTDGQVHQVAFYCLDWDGSNGRSQTIQIFDAANNTLLDSQSVSAFSGGKYLVWNIKGHVTIKINNSSNINAVVSGLFFDPNGGTSQAPATPTGLTAAAGSAQVALTWSAVSNATSYNIYRSTTAGGEGATPYKTGITTAGFTDTGLTNGTTYFYKVSALNSVGESPQSVEVSAKPVASSNSAVFIKTDAATQGSWKGVYGADGYSVLGDTTSLPTYASVGVSGQTAYTWSASTSDVRALQKAASTTDRIASCYYSFSSLTYDVNLTDGQVHQVAFYCLDWDGSNGRSQTIQIFDAANNTLLDSQSVSAFSGGKYLVWNIKGHVTIKINNVSNINAVVSGLFFGGGAPPVASSAAFVKTDSSTQGSWKGVYGADGYSVLGDTTSLPTYASVGVSGQTAYTWSPSSSDVRALQKAASSTDRIASCLYSFSSLTYDVNLTDGQVHQVAFYCLDWDGSNGRNQTIQIFDAANNTLLDSQSVSAFSGGKYLVWNIKGHVIIKINNVSNINAVVSGLFFN